MRNPRPVTPINAIDDVQTGLLPKKKQKQELRVEDVTAGEKEDATEQLARKAMNMALKVKLQNITTKP